MHDVHLSKLYCSKAESAISKGLAFTLSFAEFKRLQSTKRCYYTGVQLTKANGSVHETDRTMDRVDASRGYITGNVVACCHAANSLKGHWEHQKSILHTKNIKAMLNKIESRNSHD